MTWKCPECGSNNGSSECACGYAFYKILGIRPDASEESVKQAYTYLINLWETDSISSDAIAQKKAKERLKKINDAYNIFKKYKSSGVEAGGKSSAAKTIIVAAIVIIGLTISFIFLYPSKKEAPKEQISAESPEKSKPQPVVAQNKPDAFKPALPAPQQTNTVVFPEPTTVAPDVTNSEATEENAIEIVKKSHIIDSFFNVESIIKKWTDENAAKYQIIGWKAKKVDEQTFVVSYMATDGIATRGFYFDIDFRTGAVRHLANHPDLQKKYGIQYNR